jgi:predicted enzyme related to lactoylglutathione lyase
MSSVDVSSESAVGAAPVKAGELKLEAVVLPVSDVDRAKELYASLGWRLDADVASGEDFRIVQLTPPGSGCSIQFGTNIASGASGSAQSLYLIVLDIEAAREELLARGVEVSEVFHEGAPGARFHDSGRAPGLAPDRGTYGSFATSAIQMGTAGCFRRSRPGCPVVEGEAMTTTYESVDDLAAALRRAAAAHGKHEERTGQSDPNWPDWYALYMVRECAGEELPT